MGKYRGIDSDEGWIQRRFAKIERDQDEQAAARRLVIATDFVQIDMSGVALPASFGTFGTTNIAVPVGFTFAVLNLFASAGTTYSGTGSGNIGVQPWAANTGGSAISTGKTGGGAISVSSTYATRIPVTPGGSFQVWISAYANGGARDAGSDNVHMSGSVLFVRG